MNDYYKIENSIDKIFSNYKFYQKKLNNFQKKTFITQEEQRILHVSI